MQGTIDISTIVPRVTVQDLVDLLTISINNAQTDAAAAQLVSALLDLDRDQLHVLHVSPNVNVTLANPPEQPSKELVCMVVELISGCILDLAGIGERVASLPAAQHMGKSGALLLSKQEPSSPLVAISAVRTCLTRVTLTAHANFVCNQDQIDVKPLINHGGAPVGCWA